VALATLVAIPLQVNGKFNLNTLCKSTARFVISNLNQINAREQHEEEQRRAAIRLVSPVN